MMRSTLYFLFAVLFVLVALSASAEEKSRKADAAVDSKRKLPTVNRNEERESKRPEEEEEEDHDSIDDSALSSYANNRYLPADTEGNHRSRSRWQGPSSAGSISLSLPPLSVYDDFSFGNEGFRSGFGNEALRSGFGNLFQGFSPSASYENNHRLSNSPACHSLIDPQYPIFSDVCGAVPQARYSLPNAVGHRERWQVAQILSTLTSASADSACTRSLRLLLCPVLFPPCPTRHEPTPVLPCQSYCRAVKARCSIPALDLIPCEALPVSSDICPTNQAYGSFIPPNTFPSMSQPFPMAGGLQQSRQYPSLQSLLSTSAQQSALNTPHSVLTPSSSVLSAAQTVSPSNLYNNGPFNTDSLNSMVADYRQAGRYAPFARSSPEARATNEVRPSAESQFLTPARGSIIKA